MIKAIKNSKYCNWLLGAYVGWSIIVDLTLLAGVIILLWKYVS